MDMSWAAKMDLSRWLPPWRFREESAWAIVTTSTLHGVTLHIEVQDLTVTRITTWAAAWLSKYSDRSPNLINHEEITFMYLLGTSSLGAPDGVVHKDTGVVEVGFGTDPSGPPNGLETPLTNLIDAALELLR
jgi:hypothetical protein